MGQLNSEGQGSHANDEDPQNLTIDPSPHLYNAISVSVVAIQCLEQLTRLFTDQYLQEQPEVYPALWQDELGRLRVWAANIGVHKSGKGSLDVQLRDALHIKDQTLRLLERLLERLQRTAEDLTEVLQGSECKDDFEDDFSDGTDEDETELQSIYRAFRDTIDNLFQMSILIQRPAQCDRLLGSKTSEITFFDPYDMQHGANKYPEAAQAISDRDLEESAPLSWSEDGENDDVPQPDKANAARDEPSPETRHLNTIQEDSSLESTDQRQQPDPIISYDKTHSGLGCLVHDGKTVVPPPPRERFKQYATPFSITSKLSMQLEYYFSVDNLCRDMPLRRHMDSQGFVSLSVIASLRSIKSLTIESELIRRVSRELRSVEYQTSEDGVDRLRPRDNWAQWILPYDLREPSAQHEGTAPTQARQVVPSQRNMSRATGQFDISDLIDALPDYDHSRMSGESVPERSQGLCESKWSTVDYDSGRRAQVTVANSRRRHPGHSVRYNYDHDSHDISEDPIRVVEEYQLAGAGSITTAASLPLSAEALIPKAAGDAESNDSDVDSENRSDADERMNKTLVVNGMEISFTEEALQGKSINVRSRNAGGVQFNLPKPLPFYFRPADTASIRELDGRYNSPPGSSSYSTTSGSSRYSSVTGSSRYSSATASSRYSSTSDSTSPRELEDLRRDRDDRRSVRAHRRSSQSTYGFRYPYDKSKREDIHQQEEGQGKAAAMEKDHHEPFVNISLGIMPRMSDSPSRFKTNPARPFTAPKSPGAEIEPEKIIEDLAKPQISGQTSKAAERIRDEAEKARADGTELTLSTTASSTDLSEVYYDVESEIQDLKSRIRRLELAGIIPPSSQAAISRTSSERPRTASPVIIESTIAVHPLETDEQFVLDKFEQHATHCSLCTQALENSDDTLCEQGNAYARDVKSYLFSEDGNYFSVNARENGKTGRVGVPDEAQAVRHLLEGIESGSFLKTRQRALPTVSVSGMAVSRWGSNIQREDG
ncbi:hypothetical protein N7532_008165 [Penicillium argentinense]|uniref:HTH La-type RNA-binding domain-containing protein n=1 Tax=Penicillium argentinense TaxID=1131581 RepID=A0A9W9EX30_9EURO|nr:uncharacterized protein N7532_008165 [Penicillium argentinense]KAJ5089481.1 hypothetical protein N7532_008165 [Penicillium argentinense]